MCPFGSDFFALLRALFNDRARGEESPWSRLIIVIAYATEPHLFIRDPNQSPFNVGTRINSGRLHPVTNRRTQRTLWLPFEEYLGAGTVLSPDGRSTISGAAWSSLSRFCFNYFENVR